MDVGSSNDVSRRSVCNSSRVAGCGSCAPPAAKRNWASVYADPLLHSTSDVDLPLTRHRVSSRTLRQSTLRGSLTLACLWCVISKCAGGGAPQVCLGATASVLTPLFSSADKARQSDTSVAFSPEVTQSLLAAADAGAIVPAPGAEQDAAPAPGAAEVADDEPKAYTADIVPPELLGYRTVSVRFNSLAADAARRRVAVWQEHASPSTH